MIYPILVPNLDSKTLQNVCEKKLAVDPLNATEERGYTGSDLRVLVNSLRMSQNLLLEDRAVQKLIHFGYLICADNYTLTAIGCHIESNIKSNLGVFVGSLDDWRDCIICLMTSEQPDEIREELFLVYNHLCFLNLDYLFTGYKLKGKTLTR